MHSNKELLYRPAPPATLGALFAKADIQFNGSRPWDIQIHSRDTYSRIQRKGSLGLGESYMDGSWDAEQLDETIRRLIRLAFKQKNKRWEQLSRMKHFLKYQLINPPSRERTSQAVKQHYELGTDLFKAMLDPTMTYSCAYWKEAGTLEQAQLAKLDLICRKLGLQSGQTLLDIGCGWGSMARYAAEHYGVSVLGITNSEDQVRLARERCAGLPVRIELMDYRELDGHYDNVVSVGMFEHVGLQNYRDYFGVVEQLLKDDGMFLLQTIGTARSTQMPDPWINKYIFPNGKLPSAKQLTATFEDYFTVEDWQSFGQDYDRTLMAWWENFSTAWPSLMDRFDERFYRMWKYYLLFSAGFFRSHYGQLWQLVLAKPARRPSYRPIC
jgi:cyclopropane-fatty-acyl-phospholipid synthase